MKRQFKSIAFAMYLLTVLCASGANGFFLAGNMWYEEVITGLPNVKTTRVYLEASFVRSQFAGSGNDGRATTGDIVDTSCTLNFGDFTVSNPLSFKVVSESRSDDQIYVRLIEKTNSVAGIPHTFTGQSPFAVQLVGATRPSSLLNRGDQAVRLVADLHVEDMTSARPNILPVVYVVESTNATFTIPQTASGNAVVMFRLATSVEVGGINPPPGLSVANTGTVSWNCEGLSTNGFWTVQMIMEEYTAQGVLTSAVPVEFLLKIVHAPTLSVQPAGTSYIINRGETLALTITCTAPYPTSLAEILSLNLPPGATLNKTLPVSGVGSVNITVTWTPDSNSVGFYGVEVVGRGAGVTAMGRYNISVNYPATSLLGNFSFGYAITNAGKVTHTLTLQVDGTEDLLLTGNPKIQFKGSNPSDFSVVAQPTSPVLHGSSQTFSVTFTPSALGQRTAIISIPSNDPSLTDGFFLISGIGVAAFNFDPGMTNSPAGQFQLGLNGGTGRRFIVEASSNLVQWIPMQTNTLTAPLLNITDSNAVNHPKRFYRAILVP